MLEGGGRKSRWISGVPPLSFRAKKAGTLENYRIYGDTVGGESVGDLVESGEHTGEYKVPVTVEGKNLFDKNYFIQSNLFGQDSGRIVADPYTTSTIIPCNPNTKYTISKIVTNRFIIWGCTDYPTREEYCNGRITSDYDSSSLTFTTGNDDNYLLIMLFYKRQPTDPTIEDVKGSLMFNYGEALPYEPYQPPVTTNLYLPEQIKKVGDEAEYIDYGEQKMHRIGADDIDVTLPALPTLPGTNVLSVGTAVQPSNIEIKGKIKDL